MADSLCFLLTTTLYSSKIFFVKYDDVVLVVSHMVAVFYKSLQVLVLVGPIQILQTGYDKRSAE